MVCTSSAAAQGIENCIWLAGAVADSRPGGPGRSWTRSRAGRWRAHGMPGAPNVVIDGTLIPIDLVAADRPFYSGKHRRHRMNLQVISAPMARSCGSRPGASASPARPAPTTSRSAAWKATTRRSHRSSAVC
jgi:hypothetical protein